MRRKQVYLAEEQEAQLESLARRRKVPVALLIREAIDAYVATREMSHLDRAEDHPLWKLVGIADSESAPVDGSVAHDQTLYRKPRRRKRRDAGVR